MNKTKELMKESQSKNRKSDNEQLMGPRRWKMTNEMMIEGPVSFSGLKSGNFEGRSTALESQDITERIGDEVKSSKKSNKMLSDPISSFPKDTNINRLIEKSARSSAEKLLELNQMTLLQLVSKFNNEFAYFGISTQFRKSLCIACLQSEHQEDQIFGLAVFSKSEDYSGFDEADIEIIIKSEAGSKVITSKIGGGIVKDYKLFRIIKCLLGLAINHELSKSIHRQFFESVEDQLVQNLSSTNASTLREVLEILSQFFCLDFILSGLSLILKKKIINLIKELKFPLGLEKISEDDFWMPSEPNFESPENTETQKPDQSMNSLFPQTHIKEKPKKDPTERISSSSARRNKSENMEDTKEESTNAILSRMQKSDEMSREMEETDFWDSSFLNSPKWFRKGKCLLYFILFPTFFNRKMESYEKLINEMLSLIQDDPCQKEIFLDCMIYKVIFREETRVLNKCLENNLDTIKSLTKIAGYAEPSTSLTKSGLIFNQKLDAKVKKAAFTTGLPELVLSLMNNYNVDFRPDLYSLFIRNYIEMFDLADLEVLEKVHKEGFNTWQHPISALKSARFSLDHFTFGRYLLVRKGKQLPQSKHIHLEDDRITFLKVPFHYGKYIEFLFSPDLRKIVEMKFGNNEVIWTARNMVEAAETIECKMQFQNVGINAQSIQPAFNTKVSRLSVDSFHNYIYISDGSLFVTYLRTSCIKRVCLRTGIQQFWHSFSGSPQRHIGSIKRVNYAPADYFMVHLTRLPGGVNQHLADSGISCSKYFKLKTRKQLLKLEVSVSALTSRHYYFYTAFGTVRISLTSNPCKIPILFMKMRKQVELERRDREQEHAKKVEARGRHIVMLTLSSIEIFEITERLEVLPKKTIDYIIGLPFRQIHFITPNVIVLASLYWPIDVITIIEIDHFHHSYIHLGQIETGLMKSAAEKPYDILQMDVREHKQVEVFFVKSKDGRRLLYGRKINRNQLPFDSIDPFSSLQMVNISDIVTL